MEDNKMYLNKKEIEEMETKMGYSKIMVAREKDGTPVYAVMWTKPKVPPMSKSGVIEKKTFLIKTYFKILIVSIIASTICSLIASEILNTSAWWKMAITILPIVFALNYFYITNIVKK